MRQSLKVTLSILISLLLCGGFAVFSFTGFFEVLETSFFQPAIIEGREKQLQDFADRISGYHRDNIERFSPAVGEPFVWRAFADSNQQSTQDIIDLQNLFGTFLDEYPNLQLVRFLGKEGRKIHFSTAVSDIESQNQERRKYLDYADIGETINPEALLVSAGESPRLIIDGQGQRFIYSIPIIVSTGQYRGVAVFYFSKRDLSEYLFRFPSLDFRELLLLDGGVVINFPEAGIELVADTILEIWSKNESTSDVYREAIVFESPDAQDLPYSLLTVSTDDFGSISVLVPYSVLQLQPFMKAIVIAAFSLTVFLIVFLIFNLRQDPILILSQRIKRLQLGVLQDFIEGKESVDWQRWRDELVSGKSELKSRIKRGLGRIPAGKEAELDGMIDKSWAEIISVIETRVGEPRREAVDVSHIEQLIQRALDQGAFTMKAQVPVEEKRPPRRAGIVVEEIAVDEVVEPGEVIPAEELEEAEAVEEAEEAEAVEEVEEAEAVEEAEELEEAEAVEEVEEAEAVEEAEELEEAEAVEEAEELEEAEAVEEVEEAEAVEEAEEAEAVEEVEEAEAVEEAEELEEAEAVEEVEEAEAVEEAEELEEAEAVEEVEEPETFVETEEEIEVLEAVKEIVPLPPLEQEKLELLPGAEEKPEEEKPAGKGQEVEELAVEEEATPIESILGTGEALEMETLPGQETAKALSPEEIERIQQLDAERQLKELIEAGSIKTYSLKDIEAMIMEQRTSVVMEDGVYQIKEEIRAGAKAKGKSGRRGLRALAEAALATGAGEGTGFESGISALLGEGGVLDLKTEIGQLEEKKEFVYSGPGKIKKIQFYEDGLDYDGYLKNFRRGKTETDRLRSLVELSGKLKAVNAVIFSKGDGKYSMELKVGLKDPETEIFFGSEEPFIKMFVEPRQTVVIQEKIEKVKALAVKFDPEDLKYMQGAIVLPVVFRNVKSFILFGLPVQREWDIKEIINYLDIY